MQPEKIDDLIIKIEEVIDELLKYKYTGHIITNLEQSQIQIKQYPISKTIQK